MSACVAAALVGGCSQTKSPSTNSAESAQQKTAAAGASTAAPADGSVRYLALGDSLTPESRRARRTDRRLPRAAGRAVAGRRLEVELQNAGISGYTAGQILAEQVPQIEYFGPTIVTFQAGGNDIVNGVPLDEYRSNVKSVLDAATSRRPRRRPRAERMVPLARG